MPLTGIGLPAALTYQAADATKLDELHEIMMAQEDSERLCDIGMKKINIGHGAAAGICDAVKALTDGKKVLMVTGPTEILDTAGANVTETTLKNYNSN